MNKSHYLEFQVTQISCDSNLRAPQGCTQYYYGSTTNTVESYNWADKKGLHLGKFDSDKHTDCVQ